METISAIRQLHRPVRPAAGRRTGTGQPPKKRTAGFDGNGFLKHSFKPFTGFVFKDWQKAEAGFFNSVTNLCSFYGLREPDVSGLPFPQNMRHCYQQVEESLNKEKGLTCLIMQDKTLSAILATVKPFGTGYRLYYIPVRPISYLMAKDEMKPLSDLLISICSYWYQVTGVSWYREPCYMNQTYQTIKDWMDEGEDGEEEEYRDRQRDELDKLKLFGDSFSGLIKQPFRIQKFQKLVKDYRRSACFNRDFEAVVLEIAKLIRDYPDRSVYDAIPNDFYHSDNNGLIEIDHYLSFYWSGLDCLSDTLDDMVNNELQEMAEQVEPVAVQWFDRPQQAEHHSFDFEARLFALINEFINFLYDYDHE